MGTCPTRHYPAPTRARSTTGVPEAALIAYNEALHSFPDGFTLNRKLERQCNAGVARWTREGGIDWAHAESLAFASILAEGTPIRMTGQDTERGTFSQRHLVLHDPNTGATFTPLQTLPDSARPRSPSTTARSRKAAVLGFEYGYSVHAPDALVLWEAQFGDFANWRPGHHRPVHRLRAGQVAANALAGAAAAARLRGPGAGTLQRADSSASCSWPPRATCASPTARLPRSTSTCCGARRSCCNDEPRPLVVMTPKSLLAPSAGGLAAWRTWPRAASSRSSTTPHVPTSSATPLTRVVLCSGKVYVDLAGSPAREATPEVAVVRVEELYPFPAEALRAVFAATHRWHELVWLQEEPRNMGAWSYIAPRLRELRAGTPAQLYRAARAGQPGRGFADAHAAEQARIVAAAFSGTRALQLHGSGG